jgi:hypothetical protein
MHIEMASAEAQLRSALEARKIEDAAEIAWATVWLEACGYTGLKFLAEALSDERRSQPLSRDVLGIDLDNVSAGFLAPGILREVKANGRAFLRNVRHGLFLLPYTVRENLAIGCPVDPSFAVGGERHKNPYTEKLELAARDGLELDDALWAQVTATA